MRALSRAEQATFVFVIFIMGFYRSLEQARYFVRQYSAKNSSFSEMASFSELDNGYDCCGGDGDNKIKTYGSAWKVHQSIFVFLRYITSCEISSALFWDVREINFTALTGFTFKTSAAAEAAKTSSAI